MQMWVIAETYLDKLVRTLEFSKQGLALFSKALEAETAISPQSLK